MAQLTLYLPDDLTEELRRRARLDRKSLSAYVSGILRRDAAAKGWSPQLVSLLREGGGQFEEPEDLPPEDVELPG